MKLEETGKKLLDLVAGERLPGFGGHVGETVEEASDGGLCHSSAVVELRREFIEETAEEPRLPGAHETSDDSHEVPLVETAGLQSPVYDLLGSLVTHGRS